MSLRHASGSSEGPTVPAPTAVRERLGPVRARVRRRLRQGLCAGLAVALLAGCWGGDADEERPAPSSPAPEGAADWEVRTEVVGTGGRLSPAARRRMAGEVSGLVERYVDAAFVEGARGRAAYPGFTPAARALAVRDRGVLGAAGLGRGSLTPRSGSARVTLLSPGRRPVGATARVRIRMRLEDPAGARRGRDVVLRGRLVLTPTERGWRVFGYDLARSRTAGPGGVR